eukprot:scaffold23513_cov62-Attheya_sp.AAC.1
MEILQSGQSQDDNHPMKDDDISCDTNEFVKIDEIPVWIQNTKPTLFSEVGTCTFNHSAPRELGSDGELWEELTERLDPIVAKLNASMTHVFGFIFVVSIVSMVLVSVTDHFLPAFALFNGMLLLGYGANNIRNYFIDKQITVVCNEFLPRFANQASLFLEYRTQNTAPWKNCSTPVIRVLVFHYGDDDQMRGCDFFNEINLKGFGFEKKSGTSSSTLFSGTDDKTSFQSGLNKKCIIGLNGDIQSVLRKDKIPVSVNIASRQRDCSGMSDISDSSDQFSVTHSACIRTLAQIQELDQVYTTNSSDNASSWSHGPLGALNECDIKIMETNKQRDGTLNTSEKVSIALSACSMSEIDINDASSLSHGALGALNECEMKTTETNKQRDDKINTSEKVSVAPSACSMSEIDLNESHVAIDILKEDQTKPIIVKKEVEEESLTEDKTKLRMDEEDNDGTNSLMLSDIETEEFQSVIDDCKNTKKLESDGVGRSWGWPKPFCVDMP